MTDRLKGKVALVTGGSAGIGQAAAIRFAREGARVVIADIDADGGAATVDRIRQAGGDAAFVGTDVSVEGSAASAVAATVQLHGRLDVLFNNAGGPSPQDDTVTDLEALDAVWNRTTSVDVKGTVLMCRHAIPAMKQGGGGAIVNMSSGAALRGGPTSHIYTLSKGAILSLTRALAGTYVHDGIRANAICAGRVMTERTKRRYGLGGEAPTLADKANTSARVKDYPLWIGTPDDIANVALFLASDESRMITGAAIAADGGRSAY